MNMKKSGKKSDKKSPLERLVEAQEEQALPVKLKPKSRFADDVITPVIEDGPEVTLLADLSNLPEMPFPEGIVIANSSLNLHFNFNVDDKAMDKVIENSKRAIKGIAAAGAAMLGTAIFLGNNKKIGKIKVPLIPKIKLPKIR